MKNPFQIILINYFAKMDYLGIMNFSWFRRQKEYRTFNTCFIIIIFKRYQNNQYTSKQGMPNKIVFQYYNSNQRINDRKYYNQILWSRSFDIFLIFCQIRKVLLLMIGAFLQVKQDFLNQKPQSIFLSIKVILMKLVFGFYVVFSLNFSFMNHFFKDQINQYKQTLKIFSILGNQVIKILFKMNYGLKQNILIIYTILSSK